MAQDSYWESSEGSVNVPCVLDEAVTEAFVIMKIATDGDAGIADAGTDHCFGVVQRIGSAGDVRDVRVQGVTYVRNSTGTLNAGTLVTATTNGKAVAATDGQFVVGMLLAQVSGIDDVVPMLLLPCGPQIEDVA